MVFQSAQMVYPYIRTLYGHTLDKCPFSDLRDECRHCKTPGKFLNSGIHLYSMQEEECSCCNECHYTQFIRREACEGYYLMAIAEMAPDTQIPLATDDFDTVSNHLYDLANLDSDSESD